MAVLSDKNLLNYQKELGNLKEVNKGLGNKLSEAKRYLNSPTGNEFRSNYLKGKTATERINTIIKTLEGLQNDMNTLISHATEFYETSLDAAKK